METVGQATKLLQAVQAIRQGLEGMMANYYARAPRSSIGLDETADAICETSGIPNPASFRVVLRKTISSLSSRPELLTDGYHVMSCVIWVFCFLLPKPLVMSLAKLYTSDPERKLITPDEVRALLQDIMANDPKKEQNIGEPSKFWAGLQEYSTAVAPISLPNSSIVRHNSSASDISDDGIETDIDNLPAEPIDIDVFIRFFTRRHPGALWPLFIVQKKLRSMFLGEDYWKKVLQPRNVHDFYRTIVHPEDGDVFSLPESGAGDDPPLSPPASSTSPSPRSIWLKLSADSDSSPNVTTTQDMVAILCAVLSSLNDIAPAADSGRMRRTHSHSSMSARHEGSSRRDRSASPRRRSKSHHDTSSSVPEEPESDQAAAAAAQTKPPSPNSSSRPTLKPVKRHVMRNDAEPGSPLYTKDLSKDDVIRRNRSTT